MLSEQPLNQSNQPDFQTFTKKQALDEIGFAIQKCGVAGNNDSEIPELMRMSSEISGGQVGPDKYAEYVKRAHGIFEGKIER